MFRIVHLLTNGVAVVGASTPGAHLELCVHLLAIAALTHLPLVTEFVKLVDLALTGVVSEPDHITFKTVSKPLAQRECSLKLNEVPLNCAKELLDAVKRLQVNALADNHQTQQVSI